MSLKDTALCYRTGAHQRDRVTSGTGSAKSRGRVPSIRGNLNTEGAISSCKYGSKRTARRRWLTAGPGWPQSGRPSEAQPVHAKQQITTTARVTCMGAHSKNRIQLRTAGESREPPGFSQGRKPDVFDVIKRFFPPFLVIAEQ